MVGRREGGTCLSAQFTIFSDVSYPNLVLVYIEGFEKINACSPDFSFVTDFIEVSQLILVDAVPASKSKMEW
jgi:hypothetical protein